MMNGTTVHLKKVTLELSSLRDAFLVLYLNDLIA